MFATSEPDPCKTAYTGSTCCNVKSCRVPGYSPGLKLRLTTTPSIGETIVAFSICTFTWSACACAPSTWACDCCTVDCCNPPEESVPLACTVERADATCELALSNVASSSRRVAWSCCTAASETEPLEYKF